MQIARVTSAEHANFLTLVNAEIRPDRAKTNAWDDFPLILGPENNEWQLVARDENGEIMAAIACLVREFITSCGNVKIGGIGSVVTKPEFRGQGLSTALQNAMLDQLKRKNVPLAVLWTDKPEIYSGRGFTAAGWEVHIDLAEFEHPGQIPDDYSIRPFSLSDVPAIEELYEAHPYRTQRKHGDSERLYGMPGTKGLVVVDAADMAVAAVFCGKGADFSNYVAEFDGPDELVIALLTEVCALEWANYMLVSPGEEEMVDHLVDCGASWFAQPSGEWLVLDDSKLEQMAAATKIPLPDGKLTVEQWLGAVNCDGDPLSGIITVAVWGFDSV